MTISKIDPSVTSISLYHETINALIERSQSQFVERVAKSGTFTVWAGDTTATHEGAYSCDGTFAANLPAASSTDAAAGRLVRIKNIGAGTITVTPDGSDTIDGAGSLALAAGDAATLLSDGTSDWEVY